MASPDYQTPSWLQPPRHDPASAFTSAYHAAAQVAMEQQRLDEERRKDAMMAGIKSQQLQQDALESQQRIEVEKSYKEEQISLKKQQLKQTQERLTQTATAAAHTFAAQQEYQKRVSAGVDPDKAMLDLYPSLFKSGGGAGSLAHQYQQRTHPFVPGPVQAQSVLDPINQAPMPGVFAVPGPAGRMQTRVAPGFNRKAAIDPEVQFKAKLLEQEARDTQKQLGDPSIDAEGKPALKKRLDEIKQEWIDLHKSSSGLTRYTFNKAKGKFEKVGGDATQPAADETPADTVDESNNGE